MDKCFALRANLFFIVDGCYEVGCLRHTSGCTFLSFVPRGVGHKKQWARPSKRYHSGHDRLHILLAIPSSPDQKVLKSAQHNEIGTMLVQQSLDVVTFIHEVEWTHTGIVKAFNWVIIFDFESLRQPPYASLYHPRRVLRFQKQRALDILCIEVSPDLSRFHGFKAGCQQ